MSYSTFRLVVFTLLTVMLVACASVAPAPVASVAADTAKPAESLPNINLKPEVLYDLLLGEIAGQRGQVGIATTTLRRAAQSTRDPRVAERATQVAIYAKRNTEALVAAQLWTELRPESNEAREGLATVLLELDRPDEAKTLFEKTLAQEEVNQNLEQAYLRAASVLSRASNRPAAIGVMQSLIDLHPHVAAAHFAMAHLTVRGGDLDRADSAVSQALALRSDWEEAALFKARILTSQKQMLKTQSFYEAFLKDYPKATNVRLNYARFLIDQKEWEKAHQEFKRIIKDVPGDADATYAIGLLSLQTNRPEEAEQYLQQALQLRPQNNQARLYLGQITEQTKRYDDALRWYREIDEGEYYIDAQTRVGLIMAQRGDVTGARKHIKQIQAETPAQQVQLALVEEQILRDARLYKEALEMLNAALIAIPSDPDLLYARALTAEKLEKFDITEHDLREVLKNDPKNVNALNALGYTLTDRTTRYQEALDLLQQAITLKPDDAYILDSMGWLQFRLGNNSEAIKYLQRALASRHDAEIAAHLGEVLWVSGSHAEAESVWGRALRETPDNEALTGVIKKFKP